MRIPGMRGRHWAKVNINTLHSRQDRRDLRCTSLGRKAMGRSGYEALLVAGVLTAALRKSLDSDGSGKKGSNGKFGKHLRM